MGIFGGKIAPALLVPPYGTNPQRSALESDLIDLTAHSPIIETTEGGGFPDDTQLFIRSVEHHFTVHNLITGLNDGYTFPMPAGVKRTGLDRDAFVAIISGANITTTTDWPEPSDAFATQNPGWDDFNVAQEWRRTVPNITLLKSTLLRRRPDGTANDFFVIPDGYQSDDFQVTFVVFGQNNTIPNVRLTGTHLAGFNADSSQTWDIGAHSTWPSDFNCMEVMYAAKKYTTAIPANYLVAPTIAGINPTGGWLELVSATQQTQVPGVADDVQVTQWCNMYARFLANSPDADSTKARTFTYTPSIQSPNFGCYFRFELGF